MKLRVNNKYFLWGLTVFLAIAAAIVFYYLVFYSSNIRSGIRTMTNILMPVVVGMAVAYLLTPILNFVENRVLVPLCRKLKIKDGRRKRSILRSISILVTAVLFIGLIYFLSFMLISQIVPSVRNIAMSSDSYADNIAKWLDKVLEDNPEAGEYVTKMADKYSSSLESWAKGVLPDTAAGLIKAVSASAISVVGVLWDFIIGFIISLYIMASKEKFTAQAKKTIYAFFERDTANTLIRNFRFTHQTFIGFLGGKIVDSIIIGILCFIGICALRLPYAALVSVIIGVTNVIPFFGPFLGAIPCTLLIFVADPMHPLNCLYFAIFILILQQIDGNIIGPKILGSSTGLTGFWVIFAITLFGGLFGVFGMIIGVPFLAVFYTAVRSAVNTALEGKQMPIESGRYERLEYVDDEGLHEKDLLKNNVPAGNIRTRGAGRAKRESGGRHEVSDTKGE